MKLGVLAIAFGEPEEPTRDAVVPFLERIFLQNAGLEQRDPRQRARELAEARAPGLIEAYRSIGGSPLNGQADRQAAALEAALGERGLDAHVWSCFQFTPPFVGEAVRAAEDEGVELLVGLPIYPLCGRSTTVAALDAVRAALDGMVWDPRYIALGGWHDHEAYVGLRADHIRRFVDRRGLDLDDPDTLLYFSAHGTPVKYLAAGNRYDRYVEEHCRRIAEALHAPRWTVGFQNHTARGIAWTQPDNGDRLSRCTERRIVVDAVSFMHEQSETLAELDDELLGFATGLGKELHRVPVPWDDSAFPDVLADLVERAIGQEPSGLARCRCRPGGETWCTNGARDLPPSPYVPGGT